MKDDVIKVIKLVQAKTIEDMNKLLLNNSEIINDEKNQNIDNNYNDKNDDIKENLNNITSLNDIGNLATNAENFTR